jgi:hypothetical protein
MGTSMSMFFDSDLHNRKNNTLPLQALVILIVVMPLSLIFEDNAAIMYATYILPPINFLNERLHNLHNEVFVPDSHLLLFTVYSVCIPSLSPHPVRFSTAVIGKIFAIEST